MSKANELFELGQSLWYDNIERRLLENGELKAMIERGDVYGVTSNPSIFDNAISNSDDYDEELARMAEAGLSAEKIFEELAVEDIQRAADLFRPLYDRTKGGDGYVSIEVHPDLAGDTQATIAQVEHLWDKVDRPNLMVKIPGTKEGITAIQESLSKGININITLIFSRQRYEEVIEAYLAALEERMVKGEPIEQIASVASFFVSRIDSKVDEWLDEEGSAEAQALKGKIAVANAKLAYQLFREKFSSERFEKLAEHGARLQRPLWASTSTKNPDYPDTLYVDELIGPDTVNTVPHKTLEAFKDHGDVQVSVDQGVDEAERQLAAFEDLGLSLEQATDELEDEGVEKFSRSIHQLFDTIRQRKAKMSA